MAEPCVLIGRLAGTGGSKDDTALTGELGEPRFRREQFTRLGGNLQHLRADPAGKTAVQEKDESLCRYARKPFLDEVKRDSGSTKVRDVSIVGHEFVGL